MATEPRSSNRLICDKCKTRTKWHPLKVGELRDYYALDGWGVVSGRARLRKQGFNGLQIDLCAPCLRNSTSEGGKR